MSRRDVIEEIVAVVRGERCLVCWSGVLFDQTNYMVRADKVFLNVLYMDGDIPRFRRIAPCSSPGSKYGDLGPYLEYDLGLSYRLTSGNRRGKVVRSSDLRDGESYKTAGLVKVVEWGRDPNKFHHCRKGDLKIFKLFNALLEQGAGLAYSAYDTLPSFYITCREGTVPKLRSGVAPLNFISGYPEYDRTVPLRTNIENMKEQLSVDTGNGRRGYPYRWFYGKGVLAASLGDRRPLGEWNVVESLSCLECKTTHIKIGGAK